MPIGIVKSSDYLSELSNGGDKVIDKPVTGARSLPESKPLGRGIKADTPDSIRALVAQEVILGANVKEVAKEYNLSPTSINAYKVGANSLATYNRPSETLSRANHIFRDRIVRKASRLSLTALDSISREDFKTASLRDKSTVAKEMASIVRDMIPEVKDVDRSSNVQVIIHAPSQKRESDYIDTIISQD
jgi:predicted transcriptional regulator